MRQFIGCVFVALGTSLLASPTAAEPDQTPGPAMMSAIVNSIGEQLGGTGVVATDRESVGFYHVTFNRSVKGCTAVASIGVSDTPQPSEGMASIAAASLNNRVVTVVTLSKNGTGADLPFMLIVFCAQ